MSAPTQTIDIKLSEREWTVIKDSLRLQEETHKRNGFTTLVLEIQELRSTLNNAYLDKHGIMV